MLHPFVKCGLQSSILIAPVALYKHSDDKTKPISPPIFAHFISCSIIEYTRILLTNTAAYAEGTLDLGVSIAGIIKTSLVSTDLAKTPSSSFASGALNALSYHHRANLKPSTPENATILDKLPFYISPVIIEASCNIISSKDLLQGIETGIYLSFPLFPIYSKAVEYLEGTSFGRYDPILDPIVNTDLFVENVKVCTAQSTTIVAPVLATVTCGVEIGRNGNYNPRSVVHSTSLNVAANSASHFIKCMSVSVAKSASDSETYHTAVDAVAGAAKYAMVDYLHPHKDTTFARSASGLWNGFGYNKAHLINDNLNTSLTLSPLFIEPIDGLIKALVSNEDPVIGAIIGAAAGICVAASINSIYPSTLEYINTETKIIEESGNITMHEEL